MDICIKEHHGYFSLDMGCYNGKGFCNRDVQNVRLSLVFIPSGQGEFRLDGRLVSFAAPIFFCINEKELLEISTDIPVNAILFHPSVVNTALNFDNIRASLNSFSVTEQQDCFYFEPFLHRSDNFCGVLHPSVENTTRIGELFDFFSTQVMEQDNNYWACRSRSCLIELLTLAGMCMNTTQKEAGNDEILRVIDFLESNLHQKITIADLTKRFQTNRTDLSRLFLDYTGQTIMQYVNHARIELAAALLRDTTIPISEVMERTGFTDYAYFSKTFRKQKELSPRNYRKKYCWLL